MLGGLLLSLGWQFNTLFMVIAVPAAISSLAVFLLGLRQRQIVPPSMALRAEAGLSGKRYKATTLAQ